ncbi:hypothetical protein OK074_7600 [Actinobacteria bacterium OK074]|nr:hypothetical protein OK074_7600 [Actinobacteria bacterium OK074]
MSANLVVPDSGHTPRVLRIIEEYGRHVVVRMLVNLEDGGASLDAMKEILRTLGAVPVRHIFTAGTSDQRTRYRLPDGTDCQEGYYGIRLYRDLRTTLGEFVMSGIRDEVRYLRDQELLRLRLKHGSHIPEAA